MRKLLLPDTVALHPDLPEGWTAVTVDARAAIPAEHVDAQALVVWGASAEHLRSAAGDLPDLRLVQALSAGVDGIAECGFAPDVVIAAGIGLHSVTVAEHTLALLLTLIRRIPQSLQAQRDHRWAAELGGPQPLHPDGRRTTLLGAEVLIWGFGHIAEKLAPLLTALGARVTGVARTAGTRAGYRVIADRDVEDVLPATDVLIGILPAHESTVQRIGSRVFAALPRHAFVLNVGRGATLDHPALAAALRDGAIAGAAIDVTEPEPLPADNPLWDAPNLVITPHAAGGRPVGADERIAHNLAALDADGEIAHRVSR